MKKISALYLMLAIVAGSAYAQEFDTNEEQLAEIYSEDYTGKTYSPYAERNFASRPLFGDSHVHTALSMDAGGFGNRLGVREAYRFARGQQVTASSGDNGEHQVQCRYSFHDDNSPECIGINESLRLP